MKLLLLLFCFGSLNKQWVQNTDRAGIPLYDNHYEFWRYMIKLHRIPIVCIYYYLLYMYLITNNQIWIQRSWFLYDCKIPKSFIFKSATVKLTSPHYTHVIKLRLYDFLPTVYIYVGPARIAAGVAAGLGGYVLNPAPPTVRVAHANL